MIILDCETTGLLSAEAAPLSDQPSIIEIALIKTDDELNEKARYETKLFTRTKINPEASKVTGMVNADLKGFPEFAEIYGDLVDLFLGEDTLIAHNLPFDRQMLVYELRRIDKEHQFPWPPTHICTVEETYHLKKRRLKLIELYEYTLGRPLDQKHRAMADVEALLEILRKM